MLSDEWIGGGWLNPFQLTGGRRARARLAGWGGPGGGGGGPGGRAEPPLYGPSQGGRRASQRAGERVNGRIPKTGRISQTNGKYVARSSSQGSPPGSTCGGERTGLGVK